jgi:hypothetical protein
MAEQTAPFLPLVWQLALWGRRRQQQKQQQHHQYQESATLLFARPAYRPP